MSEFDRRRLVRVATGLVVAGGVSVIAQPPGMLAAAAAERGKGEPKGEGKKEGKAEDVTPPEDLMREHGVRNRVLLIYETATRRFAGNESFDPAIITQSAQIIQQFIEDYHERNEENAVFPRFRKAGQLVPLVDVLYQQHQAGRRLTDTILQLAPSSKTPGDNRNRVIAAMSAFIRMYRPHEAREDTELFPKLRSVVSANEFDSMAEDFEKDEHRKFGGDGFEMMVHRVAGLERELGINDLSKFTPAS